MSREGKGDNPSVVVRPGILRSPLRPHQPLRHRAAFTEACRKVGKDPSLSPALGAPVLFAAVPLPTPVWLVVVFSTPSCVGMLKAGFFCCPSRAM